MQKNAFRTFAAALIMGALMTASAFADSAIVTGSDVNVRTGPGQNFPVVDSLPKGYNVNVVDQSHGSWYEIEYDGLYGFMSASFLNVTQEDHSSMTQEVAQPENKTVQAYINAMFVRFRSGPGEEYSILTQYNNGKPITVLGTAGNWIYCVIDGQEGFVHGKYVTVEETPQAPEPTIVQTVAPSPSPIPVQTPAPQPRPTVDPYSDGGYLYDPDPVEWSTPAPTPTAADVNEQLQPVQPTAAPVEAPKPVQQEAQISGNYVRFRSGPSTSYPIINTYNKGKSIVVTGVSDDWTACTIDGQPGYVFSSYVGYITVEPPQVPQQPVQQPTQTGPAEQQTAGTGTRVPNGYICGNNVRLRDDCTMSSNVVAELFYGNRVEIRWYEGDWTAIMYNGEIGYVYSKYVKEGSLTAGTGNTTVTPDTPEDPADTVNQGAMQPVNSEALGIQIANYAMQYLGYNYCWGGASPDTGFDCSGLVYYTYSHFGYTLNRVAADQARNGRHVDDLQPGDILCFYSSGSYIGHVGIYIGDNKFVHAANSATGVIVTELAGNYAARGYEVRRIVG